MSDGLGTPPYKRVGYGAPENGPAPRERPGPGNGGTRSDATPTLFTVAEVARLWRDAMRDKSYRAFPIGLEAGHYLRAKRKRLTASSYRDYESCLDKLARYFADLEISDLEPPVGTQRLEEFLDAQWGESAGRTYNKNLSILRDFFKFHVLRGNLHGDPTLAIEPARKRDGIGRRSAATRYARSLPPRTRSATGSRCGCCSTTGYAKAH
jgi:Phage integrase, N-terminal SAM-like domain